MTSSSPAETHQFDVYARPFVPQALKNVNEAPANVVSCQPVKWIDFDRYTSTFAGTDFFEASGPQLQLKQLLSSTKPTGGNSNGQPATSESESGLRDDSAGSNGSVTDTLSPTNYHQHLIPL